MSGVKDWNTAEIRAFKKAFELWQQRSWFKRGPPSANDMWTQAEAMLAKRQQHAVATLSAIADERRAEKWDLLNRLQVLHDELMGRTAPLLTETPPKQGDKDSAIDKRTKGLVALADEWIAFEARCISARHDMTAGQTETGLKEKLLKRARALNDYAAELGAPLAPLAKKPGEAKRIFGEITSVAQGLATLIGGAKGQASGITDAEAFGRELDGYKAKLQELASLTAKLPGAPDEVLANALKRLYGVDAEVEAPAPKPKIPFQALLDAFAMVPSDHSLNAMLEKLVYTKLEAGGGDYSSASKRIRIDPALDLNKDDIYINPETGREENVNSFSLTTLHEIGHSVNSAYGIMGKHAGKPGCGGWEEVNPLDYTGTTFPNFKQGLLNGVPGEGPVKTSVEGDKLEPLFITYIASGSTPEEFIGELQKLWESIIHDQVLAELQRVQEPTVALMKGIPEFFQRDHPAQPIADRYKSFENEFEPRIALLTTCNPPMFARNDLSNEFRTVLDGKDPVPFGPADGTKLVNWVSDKFVTFNLAMATKENDKTEVNNWAVEARKCLPPQIDLKQYLAAARPWQRDISGGKIAGKDASQEAYKGDTKWWRYDKGARADTRVTDYQWRAPGEWFAELYAISWFKKVEPPSAVANEVRPYLFGGHVT